MDRDASTADIRKGYRKQALLNHPDKNVGDKEAEGRFIKVSMAYDILSNPTKRARYDRGEGTDSDIYQGFDCRSASDLFNAHFSQMLMQRWEPGQTVSGTLVADGKRIRITIHPDGSTDEHEHTVSGRASSLYMYLSTTTTLASGEKLQSVFFRTFLGETLASLVVPASVARIPRVGHIATTVISWLPTVMFGCLALRIIGTRRRIPGELPDSLAEAFRHIPM